MPALDKTAYDDLPDGVLVADATGSVVILNPAAERLLGITADSAVGRSFSDVLPLTDEQGRGSRSAGCSWPGARPPAATCSSPRATPGTTAL